MTTRPAIIISPALKLLTEHKRWLIWRWEKKDNGELTKVPYQGHATSRKADTTNAQHWCYVRSAMLAYAEGRCDGVGYVLTDGTIGAFDLDDCRNAATGEIHPFAKDLINRAGSYVEVTPSGEGLRIIGLATSDNRLHRKLPVPNADDMSCEFYRKAERFITITGNQIGDATELANIDALLDKTLAELERAKKEKPKPKDPKPKQHDLDSLIKDGCGEDFGGDRSRAVWFVIHALLKQGRAADDIVTLLLDRQNGISAHIYEKSNPEDYARKQVEKAQKEQSEDPSTEIERLAKLSALEYEQQRKDAAEKLGISRVKILDQLVQAERVRLGLDGGDDGRQGRAISFPESEPWPEPVNGAELLDEIATAVRNYVVMSDHYRDICALWCVHCPLINYFLVSPRLGVQSPTKQCGKTTLFDVLARLTPRPLSTQNMTPAVVYRVVEPHQPTLYIDEGDTFLYDHDDLRGILNGNRKGSTVLRTVGDDHEPRAFSVYTAVAIAMIGQLPDTLHDRSVIIDLKRRLRNESITPFRPDRADHLDVLARKAARWAQDHADSIAERDPIMPDGIINRTADNWRPLLAIADAAGEEWGKRARKAAEASRSGEADEASRLELLLGDIRDVRDEKDITQIASGDLVQALIDKDGRPWAEMGKTGKTLTQAKLARLLKPVRIPSQKIMVPHKAGITGEEFNKEVRGYVFADFDEAFERYLPQKGESKCRSVGDAANTGTSDDSKVSEPKTVRHFETCEKSNNDGLSDASTLSKGVSGKNTHVPTAKVKSDDLPYLGEPVEVPDLGRDPFDEHGASVAPQDQGRVASVPFMLTQEMKRRLRVCGYSDEQIAGMTPQEAHDILGQLAAQPTNAGIEAGLTQERRAELAEWRRRWIADGQKPEDLDDNLRFIIREEIDDQSRVEAEFERIMKMVAAT
jgi:putative DNA primase/helicase